MTPWQQFLVEQGARFSETAGPGTLDFGSDITIDMASKGFVAPLTDSGLMAFTGEDAAHFLHNQLTNDVEHLGANEARLAAYCSPKGRMLASLLMWRSAEAVLLEVPREIQASLQKRLQMFILRAKVKAADVTDELAILGIGGQAGTTALGKFFDQLPSAPYEKVDTSAGTLIRLADALGHARYQWITMHGQARDAWPSLVDSLQAAGPSTWGLTEILAGIPRIVPDTQDKFVPQMVNFEVIGGVNFRKGCYPGQEIVARSQYLGKLKRRMMLATIATDTAKAGMEVFSSTDPDQPCGMIVNAQLQSPGSMAALVEMKTAAVEDGSIHLGSINGPQLVMQPLPYALPSAA